MRYIFALFIVLITISAYGAERELSNYDQGSLPVKNWIDSILLEEWNVNIGGFPGAPGGMPFHVKFGAPALNEQAEKKCVDINRLKMDGLLLGAKEFSKVAHLLTEGEVEGILIKKQSKGPQAKKGKKRKEKKAASSSKAAYEFSLESYEKFVMRLRSAESDTLLYSLEKLFTLTWWLWKVENENRVIKSGKECPKMLEIDKKNLAKVTFEKNPFSNYDDNLKVIHALYSLAKDFSPSLNPELRFHPNAGYAEYYLAHETLTMAMVPLDWKQGSSDRNLLESSEHLLTYAPLSFFARTLDNEPQGNGNWFTKPGHYLSGDGQGISFWPHFFPVMGSVAFQTLCGKIDANFVASVSDIKNYVHLMLFARPVEDLFYLSIAREKPTFMGKPPIDKYNIDNLFNGIFFVLKRLEQDGKFSHAKIMAKEALKFFISPADVLREIKRVKQVFGVESEPYTFYFMHPKEEKAKYKKYDLKKAIKEKEAKRVGKYARSSKYTEQQSKGRKKASYILGLYFQLLETLGKYENIAEVEYLIRQDYAIKNKAEREEKAIKEELDALRRRKAAKEGAQSLRKVRRAAAEAREKRRAKREDAKAGGKGAGVLDRTLDEKIAEARSLKEREEGRRRDQEELSAQIAKAERIAEEQRKREEEKRRAETRGGKEDEDDREEAGIPPRYVSVDSQEAVDTYQKFWEIQSIDPETGNVYYKNNITISMKDFETLLRKLGAEIRQAGGSHVVAKIYNISVNAGSALEAGYLVSPQNRYADDSSDEDIDSASGGGGGSSSGRRAIDRGKTPRVAQSQSATLVAGRTELDQYLIKQMREKFLNMGWDAETLRLSPSK